MKLLIIVPTSSGFVNFRSELAQYFMDKGDKVCAIVGDSERLETIKDQGVDVRVVPFENKDKNPFRNLSLKKELQKAIQIFRPDAVLTCQAKPNVLASPAARKAGVKTIISLVEGLGDPFQPKTLKQKIFLVFYKWLYRKGVKKNNLTIFLNKDDQRLFLKDRIVFGDRTLLIPGIGIDASKFEPTPLPREKVVLNVARLLRNKGILEYCQIAEATKKIDPFINFNLLGAEGDLTKDDIKQYTDKGIVNYLGYTTNVQKYVRECDLFSCSSYREGFPRAILEAMACARPIMASNCIGCRDAVPPGCGWGELYELHDIEGCAKRIVKLLNDYDSLEQMGLKGRKAVETTFSSARINTMIYDKLKEIHSPSL
jgi:Glycosyltransferase